MTGVFSGCLAADSSLQSQVFSSVIKLNKTLANKDNLPTFEDKHTTTAILTGNGVNFCRLAA